MTFHLISKILIFNHKRSICFSRIFKIQKCIQKSKNQPKFQTYINWGDQLDVWMLTCSWFKIFFRCFYLYFIFQKYREPYQSNWINSSSTFVNFFLFSLVHSIYWLHVDFNYFYIWGFLNCSLFLSNWGKVLLHFTMSNMFLFYHRIVQW